MRSIYYEVLCSVILSCKPYFVIIFKVIGSLGRLFMEVEKPPEEATTPKTNLFFELPGLNCSQAQKMKVGANPFANSEEGSRGGDMRARCQQDTMEGWSFQG
jgi:hypothetical protein